MRKWNFLVLAVAVGLLGATGAALADSIAVANPSFETLPANGLNISCGGTCAYDYGAIPGWNDNGATGQWIPGGYAGNPPAYSGSVVAFSNGGQIWQNVGNFGAGSTLTLSVEVLWRTDVPSDALVQLEIGGTVCGTATPVGPTAPAPGTWTDYTTSCTVTAAQAGEVDTILLTGTGTQGDFDDVQMTVPEPSALSMLTLGFLA
jgi:hypothetical protein